MWTDVSSSKPHFLQVGSLLRPIINKCLLKVLCPVRRPIATWSTYSNSRRCFCVSNTRLVSYLVNCGRWLLTLLLWRRYRGEDPQRIRQSGCPWVMPRTWATARYWQWWWIVSKWHATFWLMCL